MRRDAGGRSRLLRSMIDWKACAGETRSRLMSKSNKPLLG
jgi:hypothetical protein